MCSVQDTTDTGNEGYRFLKLDGGMTEILRPSLYGAQHPIHIIPNLTASYAGDNSTGYSRSLLRIWRSLTPASGDPEKLEPRNILRGEVDDFWGNESAGAYCSSMTAKNYVLFQKLRKF